MTEFGPLTFWELLALIVAGAAILGSVGVLFVHRWLEGRVREGHNDVVIPIYATAGVIYAVLLAFIVIAVWEQFSSAKENVSTEASALTTLYRETAGIPPPLQGRLRTLLRDYTESVATTEWKVQAHGGTSPAARKDLIEVYSALGKLGPGQSTPVEQGFVADFSIMAAARTKRTLASQDRLPWLLWVGLIAGALVVLVMTWFLYMESMWLHAGLSGAVAVLIGLLLFTTLVMDRPFSGKLGIKPEAFDHALRVFDSVDQTSG
ncbi:MAG TPA: hypothetical protein VLE97_00950 [Gaiellaceae bacterium]|nr:hypothetical protein [Gaiellaceae bacterium]